MLRYRKNVNNDKLKYLTESVRGVITAKIKFGILLCCFPMRFLIFSLVSLMFSIMFAKTSLLFCYFCIQCTQIFQTSMLLFVSVCCYAKARCYYSCSYAVMRKLDVIIRVRMLLCEICVRNLDAIIRILNYVRVN